MNPMQHVDVAGPMIRMLHAFLPYILIAVLVAANCRTGIELIGEAADGRRRGRDALLGAGLAVSSGLLGWAAYDGFMMCWVRVLGGASLDAAVRRLQGMPIVFQLLAGLSPWLLLGLTFTLMILTNALQGPRTKRSAAGRSPGHEREGSEIRLGGRVKRTDFATERDWRVFGEMKAEITGRKGESIVARELARLGVPALHDVILSDSLGLTQIDHLVLGSSAIFVLETETYAGFITGDLRGREWVPHLAGGAARNAFQNPALQNHRHRSAVLETLSGLAVPVHGYIVSAGSASFCEGLVDKVVPVAGCRKCFFRTLAQGRTVRLSRLRGSGWCRPRIGLSLAGRSIWRSSRRGAVSRHRLPIPFAGSSAHGRSCLGGAAGNERT